jgi:hypothetical protein
MSISHTSYRFNIGAGRRALGIVCQTFYVEWGK